MYESYDKQRKLHFDVMNVGLRAQATAVGLVQLCKELRDAQVLDDPALNRIKETIADEVSISCPRGSTREQYRRDIRTRLDELFKGEREVGPAEALAFGAEPDA